MADLNELYYRYKAAEDRFKAAPNFHTRVEARAALTRAQRVLQKQQDPAADGP